MKFARSVATIVAITVLAAAGGPAAAQDKAAPAAEAPVTARAMELSKRYLRASGMTEAIDQMLKTLIPLFIDAETRRNPEISESEKAALSEIVQTALMGAMPEYMDLLAPEVAKIFTEAELEAAVAFFESPAGRALITKQATLTPAAEKVMVSMLPQIQEVVRTRICDELGCAASPAEPTAS